MESSTAPGAHSFHAEAPAPAALRSRGSEAPDRAAFAKDPLGFVAAYARYWFAMTVTALSMLDIIALFVALEDTPFAFAAKRELFKVPFIGWYLTIAGYIEVDRNNRERAMASYQRAAELLQEGLRICIYPEGTRSIDGAVLPFKKGPFILALEAQVPIVPVAVEGAQHAVRKHSRRLYGATIHVRVGDPIETKGLGLPQRDDLIIRVRKAVLALHREAGAPPSPEQPMLAPPGKRKRREGSLKRFGWIRVTLLFRSTAGALLLSAALLPACTGPRAGKPRSALELAQAAQQQLAQGHAAEARAGFDDALDRDPRLLAAVRGRVEASRRLGRLPEVLAEAEARTAAAPSDGVAWYQLGLSRFARGDEPGAVAGLRRAVELLPQQADAHYRLGVVLFDGEKFADARAPLSRAVELEPGSARYRVPLATCLDRLGDRRSALLHLAQVPQLSPTPDEAALAVQAARTITDPFRGLPPDAKQGLEQALGYLVKDAPGLAVPVLDALLEKQPDLGPAHALLGLAAQRMDEAGRAASELKRASELSPEAPQPHAWLGELYASKERPELAAQEYQRALERNPLDVTTLRKLGLVHLGNAGGAGSALGPLRAAAALEQGDGLLQLLLARTELQLPAEAARGRARLEKLAEEHPDDPEVLLRLAQALADQRVQAVEPERSALARRTSELAEKVLQLQPGNALASRLLSGAR